MAIVKLIEEMLGNATEFERMYLLLPLESSQRVRVLAAEIGVPTSRLLAELVAESISGAETQWRRLIAETPGAADTRQTDTVVALPDAAAHW